MEEKRAEEAGNKFNESNGAAAGSIHLNMTEETNHDSNNSNSSSAVLS